MHEILSKFTPQNRTTLPGGPPTAPQKGVRVRPGARADADVNVSIIDTQGNNQGATDRREQTVRISDSRPKKGPQPTSTGMQAGAKRRRCTSKPRCARAHYPPLPNSSQFCKFGPTTTPFFDTPLGTQNSCGMLVRV